MPEEVLYSQEVHERVALYITEHGGRVQVERVNPAWVFHKVTITYTNTVRRGGGDSSPIYVYDLADGGRVLVQFLRGRPRVPNHPDDYWTALYIYTEDAGDGKQAEI